MSIDDTFLVLKAENSKKARTAVIFSSLNANGFSFFNMFEKLSENLNRIYVRDPYDLWYDSGISEETNSWEMTVSLIKEAIKSLNTNEVISFGASMGGYASLKLAAQLDLDACIAMSPQTILDRRLPHTPKEYVSDASRDLKLHLDNWTPKNAAIFFGAADFVDIYNSRRINWKNAALFPVAGQDHLVAQYLLSKGVMIDILKKFADTGYFLPKTSLIKKKVDINLGCLDEIQYKLIARIVVQYYLGDSSNTIVYLKALSQIEKWADAYHIEAKLLAKSGKYSAAIKSANTACKLAPNSVTLSDIYADILNQAGKIEEAIDAYRKSLTLRQKHYGALCKLGDLLASLGDIDEAKSMLQQAIEVRPRLERAQTILEKHNLHIV